MELKNVKLLQLDTVLSSTGNVYPTAIMEEAIRILKEKRSNFIFGELKTDGVVEHEDVLDRVKIQAEQESMLVADRTRFARHGSISVNDTSHQITNIRIEDGYVLGDVKVLDTPNGKMLKSILPERLEDFQKSDIRPYLTFGLRAWVDFSKNNIVSRCLIVTFDAIYKPEQVVN